MHGGKSTKNNNSKTKKPKSDPDGNARPKIGDVVAQSAKPIDETNVGHKMLLKMGWKAGESLGETGTGIIDPIKAEIRSKRGGLGLL